MRSCHESHLMCWTTAVFAICTITCTVATSWTPIVVKNVMELGPQQSPDVTDVSRDGGYTALINGNVVWLYDDTECFDREGAQISFISNTAAYSSQPNKNLSTVTDFGVVDAGKDPNGKSKLAILADTTVGTGGWIPFQPDELEFNKQKNGQERVAICGFVLPQANTHQLTSGPPWQGLALHQQVSVPHKHSFTHRSSTLIANLKIHQKSTKLVG